tara:strand:- start:548 stop:685 length:138 start_codon:yes stop_codon:yes gene_type:complete
MVLIHLATKQSHTNHDQPSAVLFNAFTWRVLFLEGSPKSDPVANL